MRLNHRTVLSAAAIAVTAFAGGWASHAALHPFLDPPGTVAVAVTSPGQALGPSRVVFQAPDGGNHEQQPMRVNRIKVLQEGPRNIVLDYILN